MDDKVRIFTNIGEAELKQSVFRNKVINGVFGFGFLFFCLSFWAIIEYKNHNRYAYGNAKDNPVILDTRTGDIYIPATKKVYSIENYEKGYIKNKYKKSK